MAKGGKRAGAGRKKDPTKDIRLGAVTALKFLKEVDGHKALLRIFKQCHDPRLQVHILMRMREWAYDKAVQQVRLGNPKDETFKTEVDVTSARNKLVAALLG